MASYDQKTTEAVRERTKFDLDNENDRRVIREFEAEVAQYLRQSKEIFGRTLSGFNLYLHEKGLFRYSNKYPNGAVNGDRLYDYRMTDLKIRALRELWDRRDAAQKAEQLNMDNLVATAAPSVA